ELCHLATANLEFGTRKSSWGSSTQWVQLAGHEGSVISNGFGSVLKQYSAHEARCLRELQSDRLSSYVPTYQGDVMFNGKCYIQMCDLLFNLASPSVMDCKMGQRTYVEDEVCQSAEEVRLRPDLYCKMVKIDPLAPTPEEHFVRAVTKLRYMQWRESITSTTDYGFRIEAIKKSDDATQRSFKQCRSWVQIRYLFMDFVRSDRLVVERYLSELIRLREALTTSEFFRQHEVIGSSLLFAHDSLGSVHVWMIDFGKTTQLPHDVTIDHRTKWCLGNHEDGYLVGVDNLILLFRELLRATSDQALCYKNIV
ncbi:inositol-trisphosphate 3-kinase A, partial [Fasciolopsis buskii]